MPKGAIEAYRKKPQQNTLSSQLGSFLVNSNTAIDMYKFEFIVGIITPQELGYLNSKLTKSEYVALLALKTQIENNHLTPSEHAEIKQWQEELGKKHAELYEQMKKNKGQVPALVRTGTVILSAD